MNTVPRSEIEFVIFDLGGVLIDWNPRYTYERMISKLGFSSSPAPTEVEERIKFFLDQVATSEWNSQMDAGNLFQSAIDQRSVEYPDWRVWLQMWRDEWPTMMRGAIDDSVDVFNDVIQQRRRGKLKSVIALSNWEANTFKIAQARFPFLTEFDSHLISGVEKMIKPDPAFFKILETRFEVEPERAIFIDDVHRNIQAAQQLGYKTHQFTTAKHLRRTLESVEILERS